ncbi:hypothetical protein [Mycobacterium marinum]|uniref:hypothetical protein n=1 Tax=Mycobacterium marinum TaxID=1781 RepID=UPI003561CFF0
MDIAQPSWLYAGRVTELDTGASWRFVYRSPLLKGADPLYRRLLDYLDGAVQIYAKRVADSDMMFGQAELSIHEPHSELVVMSR